MHLVDSWARSCTPKIPAIPARRRPERPAQGYLEHFDEPYDTRDEVLWSRQRDGSEYLLEERVGQDDVVYVTHAWIFQKLLVDEEQKRHVDFFPGQ